MSVYGNIFIFIFFQRVAWDTQIRSEQLWCTV